MNNSHSKLESNSKKCVTGNRLMFTYNDLLVREGVKNDKMIEYRGIFPRRNSHNVVLLSTTKKAIQGENTKTQYASVEKRGETMQPKDEILLVACNMIPDYDYILDAIKEYKENYISPHRINDLKCSVWQKYSMNTWKWLGYWIITDVKYIKIPKRLDFVLKKYDFGQHELDMEQLDRTEDKIMEDVNHVIFTITNLNNQIQKLTKLDTTDNTTQGKIIQYRQERLHTIFELCKAIEEHKEKIVDIKSKYQPDFLKFEKK